MRNFVATTLAVPVVGLVYATMLLRRSVAARLVLALGVGGLLAVGLIGLEQPVATTAITPSRDVPLPQAEFTTTVAVDRATDEPLTLEFSGPMREASVDAAVRVQPATPVRKTWNAAGTTLVIRPVTAWAPETLYAVTVEAGALAESGRPTSQPVRAIFMTRAATTARLGVTDLVGGEATPGSIVTLDFERPIDVEALNAALTVEPALEGSLIPTGRRGAARTFTFTPATPLTPGETYTIRLAGPVLDEEGAVVEAPEPLVIEVAEAPAVVRFRPKARTTDVARDVTLSVRFTVPMNHRSTRTAWSVTANGKAVDGTIRWAEGDTVLVFDPAADLPYEAKVEMRVTATATSVAGLVLEGEAGASFTVVKKPAPKPPAPSGGGSGSGSGGGGGSVGGGSWAAVETYYLKLMNCTRTGGWVTSTGSCSSPGGRNVAALKLDSGISSKVSRPYAKKLAVNNLCTHFSGGNPGDRLRAAGYTSYRWAENLGCRSGDPYAAVLGSHLYFQSEKSYGGGHYVNLMNAAYDRVGIGVWVSGGRVRLVVDFYHP